MITKIETNKAPQAIGPYSQGIIWGNLVFTSGQIPLNPETMLIEGETIAEQTHMAIKNIKAVLEQGGSSLDKVIKTVCYLNNMDDFAVFNEIYATYFVNKPARSCVEVSKLPKGVLVEIEAIGEIN